MNILIVEDDPIDMKLLSAVLNYSGHRVLEKASAEQAADEIKARKPEVILLDLKLPGMDGLALARRLKQDPATKHIPIVAITSVSETFGKSAALAAGCDAYIVKPVDTRKLNAQVMKHRSAPERAAGEKKNPMNILIVDDDPTNLKLLRAQLEGEGHAVFDAHDGVDALALLERQRVDAVISDILMPRMDGYSLCHEIRKHARLHDLPIIIYTSTYTSPGDQKLALDMGADKYLTKPVSVETLVAALHEVGAQPHAAPRPDALREVEVLKEYNERLVSKLKEKNTELLAQTEALRASEERYRLLFERAPDVIFSLAPMGAIASLNHAFETITGWPSAQWLGRPFQDLIHPDDQTRAGELFQLVLGGGACRPSSCACGRSRVDSATSSSQDSPASSAAAASKCRPSAATSPSARRPRKKFSASMPAWKSGCSNAPSNWSLPTSRWSLFPIRFLTTCAVR